MKKVQIHRNLNMNGSSWVWVAVPLLLLYHVIFVLNEFTLPLRSTKAQFPVAIHLVFGAKISESMVQFAVV